jgi:RsmE family RNA methyltransferase
MNIILFETKPEGGVIPLSDPRGQHILKILRSKVGDSLLMGVINGPYGTAQITRIDEEGVCVEWEPESESPPLFDVELLVAQVRPICMKRILREAVSLGVSRIRVTGADLAEKSYRDAHLWTRGEYVDYLIHGAQQAVSTRIPELILTRTLDDVELPETAVNVVLDPKYGEHPLSSLELRESERPVVLAIGPERGWSEREMKLMKDRGFIHAGMGKRILRTETACTVGLGLILHVMGIL